MPRLVFTLLLVISLIAPGLGAGSARAEAAQPSASLAAVGGGGIRAMSPLAQALEMEFVGDTPDNGSAQQSRNVKIDPRIDHQPSGSKVMYQLTWKNTLGQSFSDLEYTCGAPDGVWTDCIDWIINFQKMDDGKYELFIRVVSSDGIVEHGKISTVWTIDNEPPTVTLPPSSTTYVAQSPASVSFTLNDDTLTDQYGGVPGSGFDGVSDAARCKINNGSYGNCTTKQSHTITGPLKEGKNELVVKAKDRVGLESDEAKYEWYLDTVPPTVAIPASIDETVYTNSTYNFTFDGSDGNDGSGIQSYQCTVLSGATIVKPTVDCSSGKSYPFDASDLQTGSYTFRVTATDKVGHVSVPDTRTVVVDKTAPTTTLDRTNLPTTFKEEPIEFTFSGSDGPSSQVAFFECQLDTDPPSGTAPWTVCESVYDQEIPNDGKYIFGVRAVDPADNRDLSPETFPFLFDSSAPQLVIDPPLPSSIFTKSPSLTFQYSAIDSPSAAGLQFFCSMNGVVERCDGGTKTYLNVFQGTSTFVLTVKDSAGNEDSETFTIYADYTEPQTTLTGVQASPSNNPRPNFAFTGNDNLSAVNKLKFECSFDLSDWKPCESGIAPDNPSLPLASGMHTFQVRAIDEVGNFDTTPSTFIWRVDVDAPETALSRNQGEIPPAFSPTTSATFNFTGQDTTPGAVTFECKIDTGAWNACSSPRTFTGLVNKSYEFQVRSRDQAGNVDPSPESYTWTVDTIPPPSPSITTPISGTLGNNLSLAFTGTDPGPGATRFQCSVTTSAQTDTWDNCTSTHVPPNLPDGTYWVKVRMVDQAGNASAPTSARRFILDKTPPDTSLTADIGAPAAFPTFTREITANFTFSATKSRPEENSTFICALDNQPAAVCNSPRTYAGLSGGRHTFIVYATDDAGNSDLSGVVFTWTVDTQFPTTVLVPQAQPQYRNETRPTINFRGDDEEAPGVPGSGVVAFDCEFDGQTIIPCAPADPSGNGSFTPGAPLADGVHELKLFAIDAVGHKDTTPTVYTWTQDTVRPDTINLVRTPPDAVTTTQVFTFTFEASGTEAIPPTLECKLDDGEWAACTSPLVTPPLDNGPHTFQVRAKDVAGNVDESPLTDTWVVDRAGPVVTLTGRPNAATNLAVATFTFSADDNGGSGFASAECRIDSGAWEACSTLSASYSDLAEGDHTFHVRATDRLGNVGAAITYSWTVDRTAPDTAMTGDLPAVITVQSITLHFTGTDALTAEGLKFECSLDNGPFESCVSPRTFPGLTNGVHNLRVRAIDGAGNIDQTPATHEWRVEVANPIQQIHLPLVRK